MFIDLIFNIFKRINKSVEVQFMEEKLAHIKENQTVETEIKNIIASNDQEKIVKLYEYLLTTLVPEKNLKKRKAETTDDSSNKKSKQIDVVEDWNQFSSDLKVTLRAVFQDEHTVDIDLNELGRIGDDIEKLTSENNVELGTISHLDYRIGKLNHTTGCIGLISHYYRGVLYLLTYHNLQNKEKELFCKALNLDRYFICRKISFVTLIRKFPSLLNSGRTWTEIMLYHKNLDNISKNNNPELFDLLRQPTKSFTISLKDVNQLLVVYSPAEGRKIALSMVNVNYNAKYEEAINLFKKQQQVDYGNDLRQHAQMIDNLRSGKKKAVEAVEEEEEEEEERSSQDGSQASVKTRSSSKNPPENVDEFLSNELQTLNVVQTPTTSSTTSTITSTPAPLMRARIVAKKQKKD